jgi:hypothetical protein
MKESSVEILATLAGGLAAALLLACVLLLRARGRNADIAAQLATTSASLHAAASRHDAITREQDSLRETIRETEAALEAAASDLSAVRSERDSLAARFRPILDVEAERHRLASEVDAQRSAAQRGIQQVRTAADRQRREVEAEVVAARARAGQEIAEAQAVAQQAISMARTAAEAGLAQLRQQHEEAWAELRTLEESAKQLRSTVGDLEETADLQSFGYHHKRYNFDTSAQYERMLDQVCSEQKAMVKARSAATCEIEWLVNGSKTEGRKAVNQILKLMLRAFNGEADAAIARVTFRNFAIMEKRIQAAYDAINKLAEVQQCRVAPAYLDLRLQELVLVHEHQERLHEEKMEQRRIRERMRDEQIAQRQIEKARQEAEEDEQKYEAALEQARLESEHAHGLKQAKLIAKVSELERRLAEAHANKERAVARAQLTRSGHVYVISNIGSFGEHVYKIGLTRRLDPIERIYELGDASVPFDFDIHAVIFAEDAPALEAALHRAFAARRVNRVNERKEFFKVGIEEIAAEVRKHRAEITFTMAAEAEDYRKTLAALKELEQASTLTVSHSRLEGAGNDASH